MFCNFLVLTPQYINKKLFFFAYENMKKHPQNLLIIGPIFFQYCQLAQKPAQISISVP